MIKSGSSDIFVNILRSKQKKKANVIFEESKVDIAAILNTKRVTDYAEFNVKCMLKWGELGLLSGGWCGGG